MHYDICDPDIRCNADKEGASIFEVPRGRRTLRILTFTEMRAQEIAREQDGASTSTDESEPWLF